MYLLFLQLFAMLRYVYRSLSGICPTTGSFPSKGNTALRRTVAASGLSFSIPQTVPHETSFAKCTNSSRSPVDKVDHGFGLSKVSDVIT